MTQEELQQLVEEISLKSFQLPFKHQAMFNPRLRTTGGRYHLNDHHLDFNAKLFEESDEETIAGIIKHELCHYHLHLAGRGYQHKDMDFKYLLKKIGGLRYAPALTKKQIKMEYYRCQDCSATICRKRRIDVRKYRCGRCHGEIKWIETKREDFNEAQKIR
ncbi:SprT family protein [Enterococcus faecium]|uniref:SprT family protein n=1 Tax=Enterococcus faecium TaxID=1352 RepID=UPI0021F099F2|nr:SprT family protein [Enterococcus faecium]MCV6650066.1 SprT family protein [Enterococcus faecium]